MSTLAITPAGLLCWVCIKEFARYVPVSGLKQTPGYDFIQFIII